MSRRGHQQARKLALLLGPYGPKRLVSSPYVRCMETLAPLATVTGLVVEEHPDLAEGMGNASVPLVRALAGETAALCTHGDIVPEILKALVAEDEMDLGSEPYWAKGSTWVLETAAGRFIEAQYLAAPGDPNRA